LGKGVQSIDRENSIDFMEKLGNIAINDEHRLFKEFLPAYEKEINNILNSFCEENKK